MPQGRPLQAMRARLSPENNEDSCTPVSRLRRTAMASHGRPRNRSRCRHRGSAGRDRGPVPVRTCGKRLSSTRRKASRQGSWKRRSPRRPWDGEGARPAAAREPCASALPRPTQREALKMADHSNTSTLAVNTFASPVRGSQTPPSTLSMEAKNSLESFVARLSNARELLRQPRNVTALNLCFDGDTPWVTSEQKRR